MNGALIFAINNNHIDYLKMAEWTTHNVHRHLDIPVCVVTNQKPLIGHPFDNVIIVDNPSNNPRYFEDYGSNINWFNKNRVDAYELTPWDKTLVIDADYVVASTQLKKLFKINQEFLCHRFAYDITGMQQFEDNNYFGAHRMPMWWATVMLFKKSTKADLIFTMMGKVRDNWEHFQRIYKLPSSSYRNDQALSIALTMANGHILKYHDIPWRLASSLPSHTISELDTDIYRIDYKVQTGQKKYIIVDSMDFHAMGKKNLGEIIGN